MRRLGVLAQAGEVLAQGKHAYFDLGLKKERIS